MLSERLTERLRALYDRRLYIPEEAVDTPRGRDGVLPDNGPDAEGTLSNRCAPQPAHPRDAGAADVGRWHGDAYGRRERLWTLRDGRPGEPAGAVDVGSPYSRSGNGDAGLTQRPGPFGYGRARERREVDPPRWRRRPTSGDGPASRSDDPLSRGGSFFLGAVPEVDPPRAT